MMTKRITTTLAALALAGLLGACGNSGGSDDDVASLSDDERESAEADEADAEEELLDWVECMRDEGVDIPDPTRDADGNLVISGNGINIGGGDDGGAGTDDADDSADGDEPSITPDDMEAATEVCGNPPALVTGDISEEDRQAQQDAALEFAECMRDEGIEDFPDPDFSDQGPGGEPQTNEGEPGDEDEGPKVFLGPFGEIDMDDPEVAAAFEACQDLIGPPGEGGGPAGAPSDEGADT